MQATMARTRILHPWPSERFAVGHSRQEPHALTGGGVRQPAALSRHDLGRNVIPSRKDVERMLDRTPNAYSAASLIPARKEGARGFASNGISACGAKWKTVGRCPERERLRLRRRLRDPQSRQSVELRGAGDSLEGYSGVKTRSGHPAVRRSPIRRRPFPRQAKRKPCGAGNGGGSKRRFGNLKTAAESALNPQPALGRFFR